MALDFPSSPSTGQTYAGPGGAVWQYDGAKWVNGASAAAVVSSFNTRTGAVTLASGDVTTALTYTPYNSTNPSGYQTAANVTTALVPYATLAAPVFTGDARAVTPTAGDNDTSVATTAFVQAAQRYLNLANNAGFSVNQRTYVSGTALGVGVFGHDRWKGGASGCTYTFTAAPPSTTITISAGTLQQVVEGASVTGGNYMLSWTGTAQGRVGAGSYAASPVAVAGITAGANTTIEFNAGTLSQVRFEYGTVATVWFPLLPRDELTNCQRFYETITISPDYTSGITGVVNMYRSYRFAVTKRAVPTVTTPGSWQYYSAGSNTAFTPGNTGVTTDMVTVTGTGLTNANGFISGTITASADL